jgi:hypothetical protein
MTLDATAGMNASWATQARDPASLAMQQVSNAQQLRSERGDQPTPAAASGDTGPVRESAQSAPTRSSTEAAPPRASEEPARSAPPPGQGRMVDISV